MKQIGGSPNHCFSNGLRHKYWLVHVNYVYTEHVVRKFHLSYVQVLFGKFASTIPLSVVQAHISYPARARSAQARRARALRALGLLLAEGAPTVGGGKTF